MGAVRSDSGRSDSGTPEAFAERVRAAADGSGRLSLPAQAGWEIFPFEEASLRVKPLEALQLPEPPRAGEAGSRCFACAGGLSDAVWSDADWALTPGGESTGLPFQASLFPTAHLDLTDLDEDGAADLGRLVVRVVRAAERAPAVGRVHVNKWGDGLAHLHVFFLGRPAGMRQLRGSNLALWEEMLPRVPADEARAALLAVARELATHGGEVHA